MEFCTSIKVCVCVFSAPSLATYDYILSVFCRIGKHSSGVWCYITPEHYGTVFGAIVCMLSWTEWLCLFSGPSSQHNTAILQEVMSELAGRSLTCQDPDDGMCMLHLFTDRGFESNQKKLSLASTLTLKASFTPVQRSCKLKGQCVGFSDIKQWGCRLQDSKRVGESC